MKKRKIAIYIATALLVICVAPVLLLGSRKECCLCNTHTSSAPHLIDLQTGDILSLTADGPSTIPGSEGQTDVSTFSFIRFHTVTGSKQTSPNGIELKIPADDTVNTPELCNKCRKLLPKGHMDRYVLVDMRSGVLYPVAAELDLSICGYQIQITHAKDQIHIVIR